jgi:hypothetical protein
VSASTQTQTLSALLFLYRHVLGREVGELHELFRARKPRRLPEVLTREEVKAVLAQLAGCQWPSPTLGARVVHGRGSCVCAHTYCLILVLRTSVSVFSCVRGNLAWDGLVRLGYPVTSAEPASSDLHGFRRGRSGCLFRP